MGVCSNNQKNNHANQNVNNTNINNKCNNKADNQNNQKSTKNNSTSKPGLINLSPQIEDEEFKNLEEWEGERYKGEGIKRMKGYKCIKKIDELVKIRENFWASKKTHKEIWKVLRLACVTDHVKSLSIIKQNNLTLLEGCMSHLMDISNNIFIIPNFCINDPYFEKEILPEEERDNIVSDDLNIFIYDLYLNKKFPFSLSSSTTGLEIKQIYANQAETDLSLYRYRLIFGGAEIKDEHHLRQHKIKAGFTIQIIKNILEC